MPRANTPFSMRITGTYFGAKVNVSYKEFRRVKHKMSLTNSQLLNKLRPMFKERLEKRIPKLIHQLEHGLDGLIGTSRFESTARGKHKVHKDIPDPLTRIIKHGYRYKVTTNKKDLLKVEVIPKRSRDRRINYHYNMGKTPRIFREGYSYDATGKARNQRGVLQGLDATCLPYFDDGHHGAIVEKWLENSQIGMAYAIDAFIKDQPDDHSKDGK